MFNTKHRVAKLGTLLAVASLGLAGLTGVAPASAADTTTTFKIHLDKTLPDSAGINLWYWGTDVGATDATTPNFDKEDGYGSYTEFSVTQAVAPTTLGFKIRSQESWTDPITPNDQALVVTGEVNEIWCTVADGGCATTPPSNTPLTVRVHVNKKLADIPTWNVYYFNNDHPGTADADTAQFTKSDDLGAYAEIKLYQDVSHTNPPINVGDNNKPFGFIVRMDESWTLKESGGSDIIPTFVDGVAEMWCETVDVNARGCSSTPPAPLTKVTIHINQPLEATHNYVIWDNHVTNNTDVLLAPTFGSEDRYGAIAKYNFSDTSISAVRFYITDGRSFDAAKITGASDMTVPINSLNGEVWCDVTAATPSCATSAPAETFHVTVHINKGTDVTAGWNFFTWSLGSHTDPDTTIPFVADGEAASVASYDFTTNSQPANSFAGWLIRDINEWSAKTIKTSGGSDMIFDLTSTNVEIWCDASAYAVDRTDPEAPVLTHAMSCSQVAPNTITVHYNRPLSEISGWEVAAFGTGVGGSTRAQFTAEDAFGSTAVIHYNPSITDTSAISFAIRKYQPFVAATDSELQKNLDPWSCVDAMADCTGGFFRQTTGNRVVPEGASEVWALTGSNDVSDAAFDAMPTNDIKLTTKVLGRGKVRISAKVGAGTTPTAIIIDVLNRKGVSVKPGISCTIGKSSVGTTLGSSCTVKGLKKGAKYRFWAHALTYGVGSSAHSHRTAVITAK